jgi:hypothetical protein
MLEAPWQATHTDVVDDNLDEEDRVGCVGGAVVDNLREECPRCDEEQRQEEVTEGEGQLCGVVLEIDDAADVGRDVADARVRLGDDFFLAGGVGDDV